MPPQGHQMAGRPSEQKPRSLSAHVRSGAIWNMGTTIFLRLSGIGVTAIVARILSPHDFGVFAVATTVFTIVWALGEFGVTSCLVRADLDVDALAPTLWSVSLISSLVMAGVLVKFAGPIAAGLGSADATRPVQVMGLVVVIQGISAVPTAQCTRDFRQEKLFLANALSFIPSMAVLVEGHRTEHSFGSDIALGPEAPPATDDALRARDTVQVRVAACRSQFRRLHPAECGLRAYRALYRTRAAWHVRPGVQRGFLVDDSALGRAQHRVDAGVLAGQARPGKARRRDGGRFA
jgi:hypothetical protein